MLSVLIIIPVILYFLLQIPSIQTSLVNSFSKRLSEDLNTEIHVGRVSYKFFNHIELQDIFIADQLNDTLAYISRVDAGIKGVSFENKKINLGDIYLSNVYGNFYRVNDSLTNYRFLLDALKKDSSQNPWSLSGDAVHLESSLVKYNKLTSPPKGWGMDYSHLAWEINSCDIVDLLFRNDSLTGHISGLNTQESCGIHIKDINADMLIYEQYSHFKDLHFETTNSSGEFDKFSMFYDSYADLSDFNENIHMDGNLIQSTIDLKDLQYFASSLNGMDDKIHIKTYFSGTVPYLNTQYVELNYGEKSYLKGDIQFIGLPDTENAFMHANLEEVNFNVADVEKLKLPDWAGSSYPNFPQTIDDLKYFIYEGKFTGMYHDFVAFGELKTNSGNAKVDLKLKDDLNSDRLIYSGTINGKGVNIGKIFNESELLGLTSFNLKVDGESDPGNTSNKIVGNIQSLEFNNYPVKNIRVDAEYVNDLFDGFIRIKDDNLALEFSGSLDFSESIPKYSFSAVVDTANLLAFNINQPDSISNLKFDVLTNFSGSNLDNIEGEILIWDLNYANNNGAFNIEDIALHADKYYTDSTSQLSINSSALDLSITGNYLFKDIPFLMLDYVHQYFPALALRDEVKTYDQDFEFYIEIKEAGDLFKTLSPGINIQAGSLAEGSLLSNQSIFNCDFIIPEADVVGLKGEDLSGSILSNREGFNIHLEASEIEFAKDIQIENFNLISYSAADSSNLHIWYDNNKETANNSGDLNANIYIKNVEDTLVDFHIEPSFVMVSDSIWTIDDCDFIYHKDGIAIEHFMISQSDQFIKANGKYSNTQIDTIHTEFNKVDISIFNPLTEEFDFTTNGIMDGKSSLVSGYQYPLFYGDLQVENFGLNEESYGFAQILTTWEDSIKGLSINCDIQRELTTPAKLLGYYFPLTGDLDFTLDLNKFNLASLEPFAEDLVSEVTGVASNRLKIYGNIKKPIVDGELKVQKASFLVDYLQTRYFFSHKVRFTTDTIFVDSLRLVDTDNLTGLVNGYVSHNGFEDYQLNFEISTDNLKLLDTKVIHNNSYYGQAYAGGIIEVNGPLNAIVMDITAVTKPGTRFVIPLYTESELTSNSFISFVPPPDADTLLVEEDEEPDEEEFESWILLNFNLEVTPDAEVQLIFDDMTGDIIKGRGNSNLKLEVNTAGDFNMFGDFIIEEGEYLFTLANFFSRRFKIKDGGLIRWTGDPYGATTDLVAYYDVTAPLSDLLVDTISEYRKKLNIECQIGMQNALLDPDFNFKIQLPSEADNEQNILDNLPDNELNKQFISLLVINQFQPLMSFQNYFGGTNSSSNLSQKGSEILTRQLSSWISQISNDFDVGFTYRPGDQISTDEVELALRTQLFNDYLVINGNFGYGGQYATTNSVIGDVEAEVKITKNGKIKLKAFNKSNTNLDYEKGPFTRGVGIFFREEFNSIQELIDKYFKRNNKAN